MRLIQNLLHQNRNITKKTVSSESLPHGNLEQHQLQPQCLNQDLEVRNVPFATPQEHHNCKKAETTHFKELHHFSSWHIGFTTTEPLLFVTKDKLNPA